MAVELRCDGSDGNNGNIGYIDSNNDDCGSCRDKGPKLYIGPWALAEDVGWSEDE